MQSLWIENETWNTARLQFADATKLSNIFKTVSRMGNLLLPIYIYIEYIPAFLLNFRTLWLSHGIVSQCRSWLCGFCFRWVKQLIWNAEKNSATILALAIVTKSNSNIPYMQWMCLFIECIAFIISFTHTLSESLAFIWFFLLNRPSLSLYLCPQLAFDIENDRMERNSNTQQLRSICIVRLDFPVLADCLKLSIQVKSSRRQIRPDVWIKIALEFSLSTLTRIFIVPCTMHNFNYWQLNFHRIFVEWYGSWILSFKRHVYTAKIEQLCHRMHVCHVLHSTCRCCTCMDISIRQYSELVHICDAGDELNFVISARNSFDEWET